jgi:hypothetical protein
LCDEKRRTPHSYPTNFNAMPAEWIERPSLRGEQLTFCLAKAYLADLLTPTETPALAAGATVGAGTQRSKTLSRAETLSEAETHGTNWSHTHTEADTVGEADTVSETDSHSTGTSGSRGTSDAWRAAPRSAPALP